MNKSSFFVLNNRISLFITCLTAILLSFAFWWAVSNSIKTDIDSRMESQLDKIEFTLKSITNSYAENLLHMKTAFDLSEIPNEQKLKDYVDNLDLTKRFPGLIGVGLANSNNTITEFVPMNQFTDDFLGSKLHLSEKRIEKILSVSSEILPVLKNKEGRILLSSLGDSNYIFTPVFYEKLFLGIFGNSNLKKEKVNFKVSVSNGVDLYERFPELEGLNTTLSKTREIEIFNQKWIITVETLPQFFTYVDRLVSPLAGAVSIGLTVLLITILRVTQHHLNIVQEAKDTIQRLSIAKSAFLANMSHEIRTPLGAIIGFAEILSQPNVSDEQRETLKKNIKKNGEQLTRIIDDILDLSKVEAGKISIEKKIIDLSSIIHEIRSVMELRAKEKGIKFSVEFLSRLPREICTDDIRLKQILGNLIGNSIKFTEQGSVILKIRHANQYLEFYIQDSGIGISPDSQKILFQPFSQGDNSSTRRFEGTGLGLALSKRLANLLGGDISLERSVLGEGSLFKVIINIGPLISDVWFTGLIDTIQVEDETLPFDLHNTKILLVEDSEDNQEIFTHFLHNAGADITLAQDGVEAVAKALENKFDLILMDIQIPKIDGKEATRRIRSKGVKCPIVALTAHAMKEETLSCLKAGCNGQITKPVSAYELIKQVNDYLQG